MTPLAPRGRPSPKVRAIVRSSPRPAPSHPVALLLALLLGVVAFACGRADEPGAVRIEPVGTAAAGASARGGPAGAARQPTVFIDPGHGGRDPGWGASYILADMPLEKDLTLDLSKRTAAYLEAMGYRVVLSRTGDDPVNDPEKDLNDDGCVDPIDE